MCRRPCGRYVRIRRGLASIVERTPDDGGPTAPADSDKPLAAEQRSDALSGADRDSVLLGELLVRGQLRTDRQLTRGNLGAQLSCDVRDRASPSTARPGAMDGLQLHSHHASRLRSQPECAFPGERWSRLGESHPGPAHYEETGPRPLWASISDNSCNSHTLEAISAPADLSSHHV